MMNGVSFKLYKSRPVSHEPVMSCAKDMTHHDVRAKNARSYDRFTKSHVYESHDVVM